MLPKFFALLLTAGFFNWVATCCCGIFIEMDCEPSHHDHHDTQSHHTPEHTCHKSSNSHYLPIDWSSVFPTSQMDNACAYNPGAHSELDYVPIMAGSLKSWAHRRPPDLLILFERMLI